MPPSFQKDCRTEKDSRGSHRRNHTEGNTFFLRKGISWTGTDSELLWKRLFAGLGAAQIWDEHGRSTVYTDQADEQAAV